MITQTAKQMQEFIRNLPPQKSNLFTLNLKGYLFGSAEVADAPNNHGGCSLLYIVAVAYDFVIIRSKRYFLHGQSDFLFSGSNG